MSKRRIGWAALMLALCVGGLGAAGLMRQESLGILYRVTGGKNDWYILGSIHVGGRGMYPLGRSVRQAMEQADVLLFECDTQSEEAQAETAALMACPEGGDLFDRIGADCQEQVRRAAEKAGYSLDALRSLKPWAVTSMLSLKAAAQSMGGNQPGVETMVRRGAGQKQIAYLETNAEQLNTLESFSPELQEYLLQSACREVLGDSPSGSQVESWPRWWADGDAQAFAASYVQEQQEEPELAAEYHEALITRRNKRMAERLEPWLRGDQSGLVTVGLMHLVLPGDSLLSELEAMGYTVQKVEK